MVNEVVNTGETVSVQLIKGAPAAEPEYSEKTDNSIYHDAIKEKTNDDNN